MARKRKIKNRSSQSKRKVSKNTLGIELVDIPAGDFLMGSSEKEIARFRAEAEESGEIDLPWIQFWLNSVHSETPQHKVKISEDFRIGKHAITVGQWQQFTNATGYITEGEKNGRGSFGLDLVKGAPEQQPYFNWRFWLREDVEHQTNFVQTDEHPVVCVSWNDANTFCNWLNEIEKESLSNGYHYRLPTEAEWEYCCRAGTTKQFADTSKSTKGSNNPKSIIGFANVADESLRAIWNSPGIDAQPPFAKDKFDFKQNGNKIKGAPFTARVDDPNFRSNAFGLSHVVGNVGEWCLDWYDPFFYARSPSVDPVNFDEKIIKILIPTGPGRPDVEIVRSLRVVRGGLWLDPTSAFRSADRETHRRHPADSAADIGFRVVLTPIKHQPPSSSIVEQSSLITKPEVGQEIVVRENDDGFFVPIEGEFEVKWGNLDSNPQTLVVQAGTALFFPKGTPHSVKTLSGLNGKGLAVIFEISGEVKKVIGNRFSTFYSR